MLSNLLSAIFTVIAVASAVNIDMKRIFGPSLSSGAQIFLSSDARYTAEVPPRWTEWDKPTFFGTIKPATEADVQAIVKLATKNYIPFLAIATGHGFSCKLSTLKDAVEIDLDGFKSIQVDTTKNLVTIGGAVTFGEVIPALYSAGKELPTGNAACVGAVGASLGAGIGTLQGLHGLILDSLISVHIVTAFGELITVSNTENADLFWALKGAGANFGIITSATYQIYDATNGGQVVNADFIFPAFANSSLFEFLYSIDNSIPDALSFSISIGYNQTAKSPSLLANAIYYGTQVEVQPYLDKLLSFNPVRSNIVTVPWTQLESSQFFGAAGISACLNDQYINVYSNGLGQTDVPTFEQFFSDFAEFAAANPAYNGGLAIQRYPTAKALSFPEDSAVYPWRNIKTHLLFLNNYSNSTLDVAVDAFMQSTRSRYQATSGFEDLEVYINYAHGDEGPAVWYGESNLPRLEALKKRWDPQNVFTGGHPIIS